MLPPVHDDPWIPVEEMLPAKRQLVLTWTDYHPLVMPKRNFPAFTWCVRQGWLCERGLWHLQAGIQEAVNVLFWMPMPPPPPRQKYHLFAGGVHVAVPQVFGGQRP
jgi:hypothetical protein